MEESGVRQTDVYSSHTREIIAPVIWQQTGNQLRCAIFRPQSLLISQKLIKTNAFICPDHSPEHRHREKESERKKEIKRKRESERERKESEREKGS